jgi:uncharacterized protein
LNTISISPFQARRFLLAYQNLWPPRSLQGKAGVLDYISRVGCIQFDPLDVTGKNPELVLQSRVSDFKPVMLEELLYQDRKLVDGWDKQMAIFPVADWPYFRRRREAMQHELRSQEAVRAIAPEIRAAIEQRGPLSSIDLEHNHKVDWWWGPTSLARAALETMYFSGELLVHHKVHTRKFYDLAERHIPAELYQASEPNPSEEAYQDWYLLRRLGSVGLLWERNSEAWRQGTPFNKNRLEVIRRLQERGAIHSVCIDGFETSFYIRSQDRPLLETTLNESAPSPQAAFIAPLDNLTWDRQLLNDLFGFYYRWEVYTPIKLRQYGYYVLPVLYGDRFVARVEPVRQKRSGILTIKGWWWEPGVEPDDAMLASIRECFEHFCAFLNIKSIQLDATSPISAEMERLFGT